MRKIRLVIADDHAVLRAGLRLLIHTQADLEVVGESCDASSTVETVQRTRPDVVTVDLTMPGGSGVKLVERLAREFPSVKVLVLTMHDDPAYFRMALAAGALGYVVKSSADTELLDAIRAVASGRSYAHVQLQAKTSPHAIVLPDSTRSQGKVALDVLSEREREVFLLIVQGHTSQAIADQMFVSVKTIESYRARLMTKLGLKSRAELTQFAIQLGLLNPEA
ncbi:MAG: response regulator transcription factor [Pirellulales bacterium]